MRRKWFWLFGLLAIHGAHALASKEVGNGGALIQIGEKQYDLADLHFKPLAHSRLEFDNALTEELLSQQQLLRTLRTPLHKVVPRPNSLVPGGTLYFPVDFYDQHVFNPLVEYRFVEKLPDICRPISTENLPFLSVRTPAACTIGKITYLLPGPFIELPLLQKALLIVHERLHASNPDDPFDIKVDVVKALAILRGKVIPAILSENWEFQLSEADWETLNVLERRVAQLVDRPERDRPAVRFLKSGAVLIDSDRTRGDMVSGPLIVSVGTMIVDATVNASEGGRIINSVISGGNVNAHVLEIHFSTLHPESAGLVGSQITIKNSVLKGSVWLAKLIRVFDSQLNGVDWGGRRYQDGLEVVSIDRCRTEEGKGTSRIRSARIECNAKVISTSP